VQSAECRVGTGIRDQPLLRAQKKPENVPSEFPAASSLRNQTAFLKSLRNGDTSPTTPANQLVKLVNGPVVLVPRFCVTRVTYRSLGHGSENEPCFEKTVGRSTVRSILGTKYIDVKSVLHPEWDLWSLCRLSAGFPVIRIVIAVYCSTYLTFSTDYHDYCT
jgi:hypothetical protein